MEENNNIDNIFRSALDQLNVEPSESSWAFMQAELSKKKAAALKKRKRNRFILFSSLVLLISITAYKLFTTDKGSVAKPQTESSGTINTFNDIPSKQPTTEIAKSDSKTEINPEEKSLGEKDNPAVSEFTEESVKGSSATENIPSVKNNNSGKELSRNTSNHQSDFAVVQNHKKVQNQQQDKPVSKSIDLIVPVKAEVSQASDQGSQYKDKTPDNTVVANDAAKTEFLSSPANSVSNKTENASDNKTVYKNENPTAKNIPVIENKNENIVSRTTPVSETESKSLSPDNNFTNENSSVEKSPTGISEVNQQTATSPAAADSSKGLTSDYALSSRPDSSPSLLKRFLSHLAIEAFYSPDYVNTRLSVNKNYGGSASQNLNDYNNEKAKFSFSTGLNIRYDIGSHWSVASGINYSTFDQKAVYYSVTVISDSIYQEEHGHNGGNGGGHHNPGHGSSHPHHPPNGNNDHHYVIQTPCGAIDLLREPPHHNSGNHENGDTLSIKTETNSSTEFISIPIMIRYHFVKSKFKYFIEAGASLNMVHADEVILKIDDSYSETNSHDGLKTKNYSLLLGMGVEYNIYKGLGTFLRPSFKYSISPINQDNPVNSYPYVFGIGAGISIHF